MGKSQRDKGGRIERKVVNLLKSNRLDAQRVPLSGAAGGNFKGDILLMEGKLIEVKGRNKKKVFWRQIETMLDAVNYLFLWEDYKPEPLVVMRYTDFAQLQIISKAYDETTG